MMYTVILRLGAGSLEAGFADVEILGQKIGQQYPLFKTKGSLPPAPELLELYQNWQLNYREFYQNRQQEGRLEQTTRLELNIDQVNVGNVSIIDFPEVCQQLQNGLDKWLASPDFQRINNKLRDELSPNSDVQILIEAPDQQLRQFPWHLWNFVRDRPKTDVSISMPEYEQPKSSSQGRSKVRVLAIIGDRQGVDVEGDLKALKLLKGTEIKQFHEPSREEFEALLWDEVGWDIFFYGGHSQTEEGTGRLFLNPQESIKLEDLRNAWEKTIHGGVQLAIFNSCDGLGLATQLANLQIPAVIVMREPIPNGVAVAFLRYFLQQFIGGKPCYRAVQEAKNRLQGQENHFPCASWMPVMLQNPSVQAPTWHNLKYGHHQTQRRKLLQAALLTSLGITAGVMGLVSQGWLQPMELKAYDFMLTARPPEPPDPRLLVVKINPQDLQQLDQSNQKRLNFLPEPVFIRLLDKLEEDFKPRMIGLDIAHRASTQSPQLKLWFQQEKLIAGCGETSKGEVISPPPDFPSDEFRVGFVTFWFDPDLVLRRSAYQIPPSNTDQKANSPECNARYSFSLLLALNYLQSLSKEKYQVSRKQNDILQVGDVVLNTITNDTGGYQSSEGRGWEMMLNYRAGGQAAPSVTLTEVLSGQLSAEEKAKLQNRIVLIGADHVSDYHPTPYDSSSLGVDIHAHGISQIISAVLDKRPFIQGWSSTLEAVWIGSWAIVGGLLVWMSRRQLLLSISLGVAIIILGGSAFILLCQGIWVPVIAPLLALGVTSSGVYLYWVIQNTSRRN